ncbi:MAG: single-stranded-DNA-specific exonuclease RecJ [candidate division KSB1 bacterium]|nr:single-stranded-DNA-specific exonuclease RecJ [candidate division KSB1 bacterium]
MEQKWIVKDGFDPGVIKALSDEIKAPPIIAQILYRRGVENKDQAQRFFRASVKELYDPFLLQDMDKAVERLRQAVLSDQEILIYGDYDVDGITSVTVLYLLLKELGAHVHYYIPDRHAEGYGLSESGIQTARGKNIDLIVTVDCGITGHAEIEYAKNLGLDVVVTDHHEPGPAIPDAVAVVDPKRHDSSYPFKELAGVGVAYKLAQGLLQRLDIDESILERYIELVAIGTAADIVPLVDENRIFTKEGLIRLNDSDNIGLKALIRASGLNGRNIGTGQVVFVLAPRLNAVGRMGNAERAVELLSATDETVAQDIAKILEHENKNRKDVDEEAFVEAIELAESHFTNGKTNSIVLSKEGWHTGVIGIVASRVVERYYRPTVLISVEEGIGKGSARSINGFDLYDALKKCEDLFIGFGGHKYAAGLTIDSENIVKFKERLEQIALEKLSGDDLIPALLIEQDIRLGQIDDELVVWLKHLAPFGPKNMRPVFVSRGLQIVGTPTIVGRNHLKLKVRQDNKVLDVIAFNMGDMIYQLPSGEADLDMAFVIEENIYMGRKSIQLRAKDLRKQGEYYGQAR